MQKFIDSETVHNRKRKKKDFHFPLELKTQEIAQDVQIKNIPQLRKD